VPNISTRKHDHVARSVSRHPRKPVDLYFGVQTTVPERQRRQCPETLLILVILPSPHIESAHLHIDG
jgi:hypothetical protein